MFLRKVARLFPLVVLFCLWGAAGTAHATVFAEVQGIVHDPQHRPITGARVVLKSQNSDLMQSMTTDRDGSFRFQTVPFGNYAVTVSQAGFAPYVQPLRLASGTSPILHFELAIETVKQSVAITGRDSGANIDSVTPTTTLSREDIERTAGADRTNGMQMITDYVPGAYMTHDMLHMRGGHQVAWLIDGVEIPNTNIASNIGPQIDPKDIDYIEVQRGSYNADVGDRTYGVFNVSPRTGFERNRQAELVLSAGSFLQTNAQLNFGDHSEKFAYYASLNGNRTDYGLAPPVGQVLHDAANGYGGFASFIYNRTPHDQLRLVNQLRADYFQLPYDPDPDSYGNQLLPSYGLRDGQHETDGLTAFTWAHTFNASTLLEVSPFYHYNQANYESNPNDFPVATTSDRASHYAGAQANITTNIARNTIQGGVYSWGQHDSYLFGSIFNDDSYPNFSIPDAAAGGLIEEYISDNFKATPWLTLIGGLRQANFISTFTENEVDPRVGIAVQIPKLHWVFRGFYGRFYQPPPLLTASGPVVDYANANDTSFVPLHGERDEEHQFGVQIPFKGLVSGCGHLYQPRQQLSRPLQHRRFQHLLPGNRGWRAGAGLGVNAALATGRTFRSGASRLFQPDSGATRQYYRRPHLRADRLAGLRRGRRLHAGRSRPAQHVEHWLQRHAALASHRVDQRLLRLRLHQRLPRTALTLQRRLPAWPHDLRPDAGQADQRQLICISYCAEYSQPPSPAR